MKPLILIFSSNDNGKVNLRGQYSDTVLYHGGIPLVIPMNLCKDDLHQLVNIADGFMFSGGVDVDPLLYGEETLNQTVEIDKTRDKLEMTAADEVFALDKPVLGICRGIQSVNVALGGSLYQDIPSQIQTEIAHSQKIPANTPSHGVNIVKGTLLHSLIGKETIMTNSFHHQAVKAPAGNLTVSATAPDGVIEALEDRTRRFLLLVQWHPEYMFDTDSSAAAIFSAFIKASKK